MTELTADLVEIRKRLERATPGPWVVDRPWLSRGLMHVDGVMPRANLHPEKPYQVVTVHNHGSTSASKHVAVPEHGYSAIDGSDAAENMEFIAHARTDIPALLDLLDECAKGLEEAVSWIPCVDAKHRLSVLAARARGGKA